MQGKIAVEEHFRIEETKGSEARYAGSYWSGLSSKLLDVHGARLAEVDCAAALPTQCEMPWPFVGRA